MISSYLVYLTIYNRSLTVSTLMEKILRSAIANNILVVRNLKLSKLLICQKRNRVPDITSWFLI